MSFKVVMNDQNGKETIVASGLSTREAADKVCGAAAAHGLIGLLVKDDEAGPKGSVSRDDKIPAGNR